MEVVGDDGSAVISRRFTVALCMCRRSRSYPWCDTSHRNRNRNGNGNGNHDRDRNRSEPTSAPSDSVRPSGCPAAERLREGDER